MLLVFLGGSLQLEGVEIVSACPKVLKDNKTDVFKVDPLNVMTSVPFPTNKATEWLLPLRGKYEI